MKSILFVCFSNKTYSATAQSILEKMLRDQGYTNAFQIDSAGINPTEEGVYPDLPIMRLASKRGYNLTHRTRKFQSYDIDKFDYIIVIGNENFSNIYLLAKEDLQKIKVINIIDFCTVYALNDFPKISVENRGDDLLDILEDACSGVLDYITSETFEF